MIDVTDEYGLCTHCGAESLRTEQRGPHLGLFCCACAKWIKWLPQERDWRGFVVPIGKHAGKRLSEVAIRDMKYVRWAAQAWDGTKGRRCQEAVADCAQFSVLSKIYMR